MTASANDRPTDARRRLPRRSLHRETVESLGPRIVCGEIPEGSALPIEAELGEELDVSRTVVREAVKVLAAKGLVSTRPRTGTRVLPRSHWDVLDHDVLRWIVDSGPHKDFFEALFEVRSIIEPQAAALAAERRTEAEAAVLGTLLGGVEAAGDDPRIHIETDLPLHAAILDASHNELLIRLSSTLGVALRAGRAVTTRVTESMQLSIPLHHEAVSAIIERKPEQAQVAMHTLIENARHDMQVALADDDASRAWR